MDEDEFDEMVNRLWSLSLPSQEVTETETGISKKTSTWEGIPKFGNQILEVDRRK